MVVYLPIANGHDTRLRIEQRLTAIGKAANRESRGSHDRGTGRVNSGVVRAAMRKGREHRLNALALPDSKLGVRINCDAATNAAHASDLPELAAARQKIDA